MKKSVKKTNFFHQKPKTSTNPFLSNMIVTHIHLIMWEGWERVVVVVNVVVVVIVGKSVCE